jgi:hypothetical protein
MRIFIETTTVKIIILNVNPTDTVAQVHQQIEVFEGLP